MFPYLTNGSIDVSAIFVGPLNQKIYAGGVLAPNGRIYCIPCNATNVGIINPYNDTIDTTTNTIDTTTISMDWRKYSCHFCNEYR